MERTTGSNVRVTADSTGALIYVEWTCPHCEKSNIEFGYSKSLEELKGPFETYSECHSCKETVAVECYKIEGEL